MSIFKTRDKLSGYGIDDETLETLAEIYPFLTSVLDDVLDKFYVDLMENERTSLILEDENVRVRARMAQKKHWINYVLSGNYGHNYFNAAERIGQAHWNHGVNLTDFSSAYHRVLGYLTQHLVSEYIDNPTLLLHGMMAIQKVTFMDLECASNAYRDHEKENQRRLFQMDPLTETGNRAAFLEEMDKHLKNFGEKTVPVSIAIVDLDHFKVINDTYGHVVGDRVLKMVASGLKDNIRDTDKIYRYGGDEFVAVMPGAGEEEAAKVMQRTLEAIRARSVPAREEEVKMTVSIGVAEQDSGTDTLEKFLEKADKALYRAKEAGRNKVAA
ncbi:diguanylate cyclase [Emcibacter nanhaiensis]|uniref:Diguanylate cyclase DosC n=1 Tax=Emcibacter nanhaiensis TaxID=1505037 RepID=A0A501PH21_9PROT|nr:diguanylate cyclase [Emcibacter nanhaiensis]TPD59495.1 diguanylate cyclase [Emcibacter nanhaiensis]